MTNTANLTPEAQSALINASAPRRGAIIPAQTTDAVFVELMTAGLIGAQGGLTDAGVTARTRIVNARMDF